MKALAHSIPSGHILLQDDFDASSGNVTDRAADKQVEAGNWLQEAGAGVNDTWVDASGYAVPHASSNANSNIWKRVGALNLMMASDILLPADSAQVLFNARGNNLASLTALRGKIQRVSATAVSFRAHTIVNDSGAGANPFSQDYPVADSTIQAPFKVTVVGDQVTFDWNNGEAFHTEKLDSTFMDARNLWGVHAGIGWGTSILVRVYPLTVTAY